ncbi:MAG: hypothetical protein IJV40_10850 [Oscillospiraceae bacterium]|nr:hypothetical protein [Oscillospiraceae bacterium]
MLNVREANAAEIGRFYSALEMDFDRRELLPLGAIRRAVRRGDQEFLLFYDDTTGMTQGYALCGVRNVYGYVLLKYFGIFSWYQDHGLGVEAMRLLHKRYADRQGILAELTVFDDSEGGDYLRKLKRFFARFGYEEVPCSYRLGGAEVFLTAKPIRGTAEIAPVAKRILIDFYSRCLRPAQLDKMLVFTE